MRFSTGSAKTVSRPLGGSSGAAREAESESPRADAGYTESARFEAIAAGEYDLRLTAPGPRGRNIVDHATSLGSSRKLATITLTEASLNELEIDLGATRPGGQSVMLMFEKDPPPGPISVHAEPVAGTTSFRRQGRADAAGEARLSKLDPGLVMLSVGGADWLAVADAQIEIVPGTDARTSFPVRLIPGVLRLTDASTNGTLADETVLTSLVGPLGTTQPAQHAPRTLILRTNAEGELPLLLGPGEYDLPLQAGALD